MVLWVSDSGGLLCRQYGLSVSLAGERMKPAQYTCRPRSCNDVRQWFS